LLGKVRGEGEGFEGREDKGGGREEKGRVCRSAHIRASIGQSVLKEEGGGREEGRKEGFQEEE
jgi:hypothetical protein